MKTLEEVKKAGAAAHAQGQEKEDNPYCFPENMPLNTGLSFEEWQKRFKAWSTGWQRADLLRDNAKFRGLRL